MSTTIVRKSIFHFGVLLFCFLSSCSSVPRTTRMQVADMLETTDVMSNSLKTSLFFAECQTSEEPIRLSYQKAENLSSDMFRPSEQWIFVERVIDSVPLQELKNSYNITTVRAADKMKASEMHAERNVTHLMTAKVTSITRDAYKDRTDAYKCQYEIMNLQTGETVWSDSYEIKRMASGLSWD